jgi:integrase/recombinase XerD
MLTIYPRHKKTCPHRDEGRTYRRCKCPKWVDGRYEGIDVRQSLKVTTWDEAEVELEKLKTGLRAPTEKSAGLVTLADAWDAFEADAKARGLKEASLRKYAYLRTDMERFATDTGLRFVSEFDLEALRKWRAGWVNKNVGALKKLELVRAFMGFAHDAGWIHENAARKLKAPKVSPPQTLPFDKQQMTDIYSALAKYSSGRAQLRMRAFVLVLRWTGMRIGDTVSLEPHRIKDGKLFVWTAKAGTPVYCPLPQFVQTALEAIHEPGTKHYFWSGRGKLKTAITDWQEKLQDLFALAKIENGHAHRFRDTFACELLLAGVPIERVSKLLAHSSVQITEKYYSAWVRARQEQMEEDVKSTWGMEIVPEFEGTPQVHEERQRPN